MNDQTEDNLNDLIDQLQYKNYILSEQVSALLSEIHDLESGYTIQLEDLESRYMSRIRSLWERAKY